MGVLADLIRAHEPDILADWLDRQHHLLRGGSDLWSDSARRQYAERVLSAIVHAGSADDLADVHAPEWRSALDVLSETSAARARAGYSAQETATYFFSLKQPVFSMLQRELSKQPMKLTEALWSATTMIDQLGLHSVEVFQRTREEVIKRQQQELLELSTPVVRLFDELIAVPLIGTLDSARTQVVMENLLESIVRHSASIAILDITGVPTVDTQVAQHLLQTVAAARLMGADCIISGVRPQIAQTIVHLGVELHNVTTKATMADALKVALQRLGYSMTRRGA